MTSEKQQEGLPEKPKRGPIPSDASLRFSRFVTTTLSCWNWSGAKNEKGYGLFSTGHSRKIYAHRFSYIRAHGLIPEGTEIHHTCNNPSCVNPQHLEAITHKENMSHGKRTTQTHCKRGHLFDERNTYRHSGKRGNSRGCRKCRADYQKSLRQTLGYS